MKRDKAPLPTKEQIGAISSVEALEALLADVIEDRMAIETQLEFSSRDEEWESRAMGALTAHRIAEHNVRHQIAKVTGRSAANYQANESARLAKAERAKADALAASAAALRKKNEAMVVRTNILAGIHKAITRTNYLARFHEAAHALLDEETCRRLSSEAQRGQAEALAALVNAVVAPDCQPPAEPAE
jgi:hypothetical protein